MYEPAACCLFSTRVSHSLRKYAPSVGVATSRTAAHCGADGCLVAERLSTLSLVFGITWWKFKKANKHPWLKFHSCYVLIKWRLIRLVCIKILSLRWRFGRQSRLQTPTPKYSIYTSESVMLAVHPNRAQPHLGFFPPCLQSYSSVRKTSNLHLTILFNQRWNLSI